MSVQEQSATTALDAACLMLTTTFLIAGCLSHPTTQVINEKLWLKADHEQWALSLGLQGDASGHFNDARMYQARKESCAFRAFVRNICTASCTQSDVTAPMKRGRRRGSITVGCKCKGYNVKLCNTTCSTIAFFGL